MSKICKEIKKKWLEDEWKSKQVNDKKPWNVYEDDDEFSK